MGLFNLKRHKHRGGLSLEPCKRVCVCRVLRKQQTQFRSDRRENFLLEQMGSLRNSLGEWMTSVKSRSA